jgi:hypothetical protein
MTVCSLVHGYLCLSVHRLTYHSTQLHSPEDYDLKSCTKSSVIQPKNNSHCWSCLGDNSTTRRCIVSSLCLVILFVGFVISAICELERNAIQLALGSFYPTLLLSGKLIYHALTVMLSLVRIGESNCNTVARAR